MVRAPVVSGIAKWVYRHISQEECPWNEKFALPLREDAFRPRAAIAGKDARTLARDILAMDDESFRTAFKGSPMKRAKLRGLKRNASVVLGNLRDRRDVLGSTTSRLGTVFNRNTRSAGRVTGSR